MEEGEEMTVAELIQRLQNTPQDAVVHISEHDDEMVGGIITDVQVVPSTYHGSSETRVYLF